MCEAVVVVGKTFLVYLVVSICMFLLFFVLKLFHKLWWTPFRVQKLMASQGIRGPRYRFLHGNTKEMIKMGHDAMIAPMELSHHVFPRLVPHIYSWKMLYGMNFLNWIGSKPQLVVTDPEMVKLILNRKDGAFPKSEPQAYIRKLLGDGLVTSEGQKWQKQRKLANHAFHAERLKDMTPAMISSVELMLERWRTNVGREIDVFEEFKLLTSEVISRTAFGSSYLEGENIFDMLTKMTHIISKTAFKVRIPVIGKFIKTSEDLESDKLVQDIRNSILNLIRKREEKVRIGESFGSDYLGSLVEAHHSKKISVDDMVDECKTFYVAGQETTLSLLCWTVLLLAVHSDWQEKARNEVLESFSQENPSSQGLARLTTMGMIISESLRLYSPVVRIIRKVAKQVRLGDLILPSDMEVYISTLALSHDPKIWGEDAHLFRPERFAQGAAKAANNNIAAGYIPFGLGPRTCVGLNFATNETKIALSMILQRYRFTLSPSYVHSPVVHSFVHPQNGMQIILHPL